MIGEELFCRLPSNWLSDPSMCWFEWQTMVGGFLAVIAAVVSIHFLRKQIASSEKQESLRVNRHHLAVRTTLPLTLSGLCACLRKMLLELDDAKSEIKKVGQDAYAGKFNGPPPPSEHIEELKEVVQSTDEETVLKSVAEIIREMQTLWSRAEVLNNKREMGVNVGISRNLDEYIIQTAKIYALVEGLFKYARSRSELGPKEVTWERVESILMRLGIEDNDLREIIKKGLETGPNFWTMS